MTERFSNPKPRSAECRLGRSATTRADVLDQRWQVYRVKEVVTIELEPLDEMTRRAVEDVFVKQIRKG